MKFGSQPHLDMDRSSDFRLFVQNQGSGFVPCRVAINPTIWDDDPLFFESLVEENPQVGITMSRNTERIREFFRDDQWGCAWHYPGKYLDGQVIKHPLENWDKLGCYRLPSAEQYVDWKETEQAVIVQKQTGRTVWGHVEHGFLYLRLSYLRGFNNFMLDMAEQRSEIILLRDMVLDYWAQVVQKWLDIGVDAISFADDLGHQNALPIHPSFWKIFFKPAYEKIFSLCTQHDVIPYLHTDGFIVDIISDLIEIGVRILNPQDLVNGIERLEYLAKGKTIIDLDIDRQRITVFGGREDIDAHIKLCIAALGSTTGGLILTYGAYPGTPKENVAQVIRSMQKYCDMWIRS